MRYIQRPIEVDAHQILGVEDISSLDNPLINLYKITTAKNRVHIIEEQSWAPQVGDYWIIRPDGSHYFLGASSFESLFKPAHS